MTTISEGATVDEGHLVPALRAQCVVADTNPNVNPQNARIRHDPTERQPEPGVTRRLRSRPALAVAICARPAATMGGMMLGRQDLAAGVGEVDAVGAPDRHAVDGAA